MGAATIDPLVARDPGTVRRQESAADGSLASG